MSVKGKQKLIPQTQENITEVRWFKSNRIDVPLSNTYGAIIEVLKQMDLVKSDNKG